MSRYSQTVHQAVTQVTGRIVSRKQLLRHLLTKLCVGFMASVLMASLAESPANAQDTTDDLKKAARNPVASVVKIPVEQDTFWGTGSYGRMPAQLQVQPVIPFQVSEDWLLVPRIVATVFVYQPDVTQKIGATSGMGDTNPTLFLTPAKTGKVIWGAGPSILIPTATNAALGLGKWGMGPSAVVLTQPKWGSLILLIQNIWSFAGDVKRSAVNQMLLQYGFSFNLPRDWYVTTQPSITADWTQPRSNRWVIPLGGGIGRTFKIGNRGLDTNAAIYRNVVRPDEQGFSKWQLALQLTMLFEKKANTRP
jgi:hypothetical protein